LVIKTPRQIITILIQEFKIKFGFLDQDEDGGAMTKRRENTGKDRAYPLVVKKS